MKNWIRLRLKYYRTQHGYTQAMIADMIGCTSAAYGKYELGERQPSIDVLVFLADLYHISVDELIGHRVLSPSTLDEHSKVVDAGEASAAGNAAVDEHSGEAGEAREEVVDEHSGDAREAGNASVIEHSNHPKTPRLKKQFDVEFAKTLNSKLLMKCLKKLEREFDILTVCDVYHEIEQLAEGSDPCNTRDLTKVFGVSRSGYYYWKKNGDTVRKRNQRIADEIVKYIKAGALSSDSAWKQAGDADDTERAGQAGEAVNRAGYRAARADDTERAARVGYQVITDHLHTLDDPELKKISVARVKRIMAEFEIE